jgi:hypothetical protein
MAKFRLRRRKVSIEQLKVKDNKNKHINGSVGGDICIFLFLAYLDRCFALLKLHPQTKFDGAVAVKEGWKK